MRGFLSPAVKAQTSENQNTFRTLARSRRAKVAKAAQTSLLKVDQWARGEGVTTEIAEAIERAIAAGTKKSKK